MRGEAAQGRQVSVTPPEAQSGRGRMAAGEWGLLAGLSVLWGGAFFFTGVAVHDLPTFTIVLLRVGLAAGVLLVVLRMMGLHMPRDAGSWAMYFGLGLLNNVLPFCLVAWGQLHVASSVASILNATAPFATLILGHYCTGDERLTARNVSGVAAGGAGVAVMMGGGLFEGVAAIDLMAYFACLLAALCYAVAAVFGLRFKRADAAPITYAAGQLIAATVLLLPTVVLLDRPLGLSVPGWSVWGAIFALALLSTALAYVVYFRLLMSAGATNLLLVTFLIPVSACLLGAMFLGDRLGHKDLAGFALIGLGLAVIDGRIFRTGWLKM